MKLIKWDEATAKRELSERWKLAQSARGPWEALWRVCTRKCFKNKGGDYDITAPYYSDGYQSRTQNPAEDVIQPNICVNYIMRDVRYVHSQLSSNPPSVTPTPVTSDPSSKRKADAANRVCKYAMRQYKLQDVLDRCAWWTLTAGSGIVKIIWDQNRGDIVNFDPETGDILFDGDLEITVPSLFNIFPDPAKTIDDIRFVFEMVEMDIEKAIALFGQEKADLIKSQSTCNYSVQMSQNRVQVLQYWEKGLPYNGMQGRFCWCLKDGTPLTAVIANPFGPLDSEVKKAVPNGEKKPKFRKAYLPYYFFTEIDALDAIWGFPTIAYSAELQDEINLLDNVMLDGLRAHGIPRLMLPSGTKIGEDSITNTPYDIVSYDGERPPSFMEPMPVNQTGIHMREQLKQGVSEIDGINEGMLGQQTQERSGALQSLNTQNGNMIRNRFFYKYSTLVESVYHAVLFTLAEKWDSKRTIRVLGMEKAFEAKELQGADFDDGFELRTEYDAYSLNPTERRQQIMTSLPLFEKMGLSARQIAQKAKIGDLEHTYDLAQMSEDRQREIFEAMIQTGTYIPPRKIADHTGMLEYAYTFVMSCEYRDLAPELKELIDRHIEEREQIDAEHKAKGAQPLMDQSPLAAMGAGAPEAPAAPQEEAPVLGGLL